MDSEQHTTPDDPDTAARVAALFDELAHLLRGNPELARRTLDHLHEQAEIEGSQEDVRCEGSQEVRCCAAVKPRRRIIGYIRVSTEEQARDGVSLAAQRSQVTAYAQLYHLELVEVAEDASASAGNLDRPGLQRALEMIAAGKAEGLLVAKLDRLTRSVRDLDELIHGTFAEADLLSVGEQIDTSTAAGRLALNVLASVTQWYREAISERGKVAQAHLRSQNKHCGGGIPYGWRLRSPHSQEIIEDDAEQAVILQAQELAGRGLSLREIGEVLAERRLRPRNGRRWHPQQVKRLLQSGA